MTAVESIDKDILAARFASRVRLAKMTEDEAVAEARRDWAFALKWIGSTSSKEGTFLWYCDEFDLDPGAVRRAIKEKRK